MTIIMVMDRTLPLANVKAHLSEIVDQVESRHRQQREDSRGALGAHTIQPEQRAGAA